MKNRILTTSIVVMTAATFVAGIASAQSHGQNQQCDQAGINFESLDMDGNDAVTAAEIAEKAMQKFNETDADGFLSADEFFAAGQARMAARQDGSEEANPERAERRAARFEHKIEDMIERRDENGDGMLSLQEMQPENAEERFLRADTDENGEVSEAEFAALKEARAERGQRNKKPGRRQAGCDNT